MFWNLTFPRVPSHLTVSVLLAVIVWSLSTCSTSESYESDTESSPCTLLVRCSAFLLMLTVLAFLQSVDLVKCPVSPQVSHVLPSAGHFHEAV